MAALYGLVDAGSGDSRDDSETVRPLLVSGLRSCGVGRLAWGRMNAINNLERVPVRCVGNPALEQEQGFDLGVIVSALWALKYTSSTYLSLQELPAMGSVCCLVVGSRRYLPHILFSGIRSWTCCTALDHMLCLVSLSCCQVLVVHSFHGATQGESFLVQQRPTCS